MPPFFSRITGKDRSATAGHKGSVVQTPNAASAEPSPANSVPGSVNIQAAPRVMINDEGEEEEEEEEEESTPSNVPRTKTDPFGVISTRKDAPPPIPATPPNIVMQVESDFPDVMTPTAAHPGDGPPPGLGVLASSEAKPAQPPDRVPSRSSSIVSLSLHNKISQASLRNQSQRTHNGQRSRRGSLASSDGGSVNRNNTVDTITQFQPAALGRSASIPSSSLLAAPTIDSDNVSIRSGVSTSGKKKRIWPTKKQNTGGIAGALAQSGMSLAYHGAGMTAGPPLVPQNSPPRRPTARGNHVSRTSIDNVLQPRRGSLNSNGRLADEQERYPEDSDEIYESPDALSFDEDDMPVTGFAVASSKRNADFHELFPNIEEGDYLIEDYGCALQRDILVQGRLYISENHLCFHANIFGWITNVTIAFTDIINMEKKMTAFVIPNAIQITARNTKYTFASFITRDTSFDVIQNIWRLSYPRRSDTKAEQIDSRSDSLDAQDSNGAISANGIVAPIAHRVTQCACGKRSEHYDTVMMDCVMPGIPQQIHTLMWTSGFIRDFMANNQRLTEIQTSDWAPQKAGSHLLSRTLSYVKPLNNSLGPRSIKCECTDETVYADFDDYVSNITTTRTPNVPSGGAFCVKTRTCLSWASAASTRIKVTSAIEWTGRSYIKSMIEKGAMEGQRSWHVDLEVAMRAYINQHRSEFFPAGEEVPELEAQPQPLESDVSAANASANMTAEDIRKAKQRETEAKSLQWALDTFNGAWNVGVNSARGAIEVLSELIELSSSSSILVLVVIVLVLSNLWTMSNLKSEQKKAAELRYQMRMNEGIWAYPRSPAAPLADSEALRALLESLIPPRTAPGNPPQVAAPADAQLSPAEELSGIQDTLNSLQDQVAELKARITAVDSPGTQG